MNTIASKLNSSELAVFEALVANARTGLKRPAIVQATGVPRMTVRRILIRFQEKGVVVPSGRDGKAPLFRLNSADREVVEIARTILDYTVRMSKVPPREPHPLAKASATRIIEARVVQYPSKAPRVTVVASRGLLMTGMLPDTRGQAAA